MSCEISWAASLACLCAGILCHGAPSQKRTFALRHTIFTHFLLSILFSMAFVVWGAFPSRFLMRFLTRAYMRAFPGISTFLLSQPSHASYFKLENRVAVVTWNQCWKSRDCASFQGEICEVVKICPKSTCYDLIQRALCGNLWRLWKQKGINSCSARVRARARGMGVTLFKGAFVLPCDVFHEERFSR